jgi:Chaperone of endosialidase
MPRDGANIYHYPPGTPGAPNTTIASAPYNGYIADVEQDLNLPRPIVAGGTGATTAAGARTNLQAERASQVITNFDTHAYEIGSFYAASTATAPPGGLAHQFTGVVYGVIDAVTPANTRLVVEARDLDDASVPGLLYVREKIGAGAWSAWTIDASDKVAKSGDTMSGPLIVTPKGSTFGTAAGTVSTGAVALADANILLYNFSANNWCGFGVDGAGSFWARVGLSGTPVPAFWLNAANNRAYVAGDPVDPLGIATKQYAVARAGDTMTGALSLFTGSTAPTPAVADNSTKIATTAFVNQDKVVGTTVDFNTLTAPGTYVCSTSDANPNEPTGAGQWYVRVATYGGAPAYVVQMAHSLITEGLVYTRICLASSWKPWVRLASTAYADTKVAKAGDTMTGPLSISFPSAQLLIDDTGSSGAGSIFTKVRGVTQWQINCCGDYDGGPLTIFRFNPAGTFVGTPVLRLDRTTGNAVFGGSVDAAGLFLGRPGIGAAPSYPFSLNWTGSVLQAWVNSSNVGTVQFVSDYRAKENVADLPSMWDTVKALRPIQYNINDWTPPWEADAQAKRAAERGVEAEPFMARDPRKRWGFIAHELQATTVETAATGFKDAPNIIQSPDPMIIIAALTKVVQELQARVEALEAAP